MYGLLYAAECWFYQGEYTEERLHWQRHTHQAFLCHNNVLKCMKMLAKGTMHKVNFSQILNCSDVGNTAKFLWYPSYLTNKEILFISLMRWFKSSD